MPPSNSDANVLVSFVILLIIAGLTSYYAERKGRNPAIWFVISILIGFFAPLILFFLPSLKSEEESEIKAVTPTIQQRAVIPPPPPFQPRPEQDRLWYYLDQNHHQYGPVSTIALKELWDTGRLELISYVWTEGMDKWEQVDNLPELKNELHKVQM